jgi:hypothetical protein
MLSSAIRYPEDSKTPEKTAPLSCATATNSLPKKPWLPTADGKKLGSDFKTFNQAQSQRPAA